MAPALYLIRHCESSGPSGEASLTPRGFEQAEHLADFMSGLGVRRIVSSPYVRAQQTVTPLAERLQVPLELDGRLAERAMEFIWDRDDWVDRVHKTFIDLDLVLDQGESSRAAQTRGMAAIEEILRAASFPTAVAGHGQLTSLVLSRLTGQDPFEIWVALTNPDVFAVSPTDSTGDSPLQVERVWS